MFRPLLFLLALCCCAGCFDVTEEFWFNKDRSGRYEMSINLSSVSGIMAMIEQMAPKTDSLGTGINTRRDTLIQLSTLPDSLKRRLPFPGLADRTSIALKMENGFGLTFAFDFQNVQEVEQFWENFSAADSLAGSAGGDKIASMAGFRQMVGGFQSMPDWQGRTLSLRTIAPSPGNGINPWSGLGEANPMVKMMFGQNKYRRRFHFVQKVRTVEGKNMKRKGREVEAVYPLLDVLRDPAILSCSIKLRR